MGIRRLIMILVAAVALSAAVGAQIRIIPREQLEAVANPRHSSDSAYLDFKVRDIIAEPMNEDDSPRTFIYRFTNTGTESLTVKRLVSSCSCAYATCPVRTVAPGESAEINVRYNPKGHPGKFVRKVFVYTQDGNAPAATLTLSVNVSVGADLSSVWPVQMGFIRLRSAEVKITEGVKSVERLKFINLGGKPLRLECDRTFLPGCLSMHSEPAVVEDGKEGEIVIEYDPSLSGAKEVMTVILKGLGVPPSRSSVTVRMSLR